MDRSISSLRRTLYAGVALSLILGSTSQVMAAADTVITAPPLKQESSAGFNFEASGLEDDSFLSLVEDQMAENPADAETIAAQAKDARPHLATEIDAALEQQVASVVEAPADSVLPAGEAAAAGAATATAGPSTALVVGGVALVAGGGAAVAMSGGGGGSDGGDSKKKEPAPKDPEPKDPTPKDPEPPPPPPPNHEDFETSEYGSNYGMIMVGASHAYAAGATGEGVKVAVIDTGIDVDNPEFEGRIENAFNAYNSFHGVGDVDDVSDPDGHGTHVSGIIGAAKDGKGMHGVAFNSTIIPISISTGVGDNISVGDWGEIAALGIHHALDSGARVINNSYGVSYSPDLRNFDPKDLAPAFPEIIEAFDAVVEKDALMVVSTGNDGDENPLWPAAAPVLNEYWADNWIAVGALDLDGERAWYSNACGDAADWCIFAPGSAIYSTLPGGEYDYMSGTSMAAPMVSGGVALLLEAFPHLKASEVRDILFTTADEIGPKEIFGHGAMNLERAFAPVGEVAVPLGNDVNGKSIALGKSSFRVSAAFGDGIAQALDGHSVMALDDYNRGYHFDLSNMAQSSVKETRKDALHRLKLFGGIEERSVNTIEQGPFSITTATRLKASDPAVGSTPYSRVSFGFAGQNYTAEISMNPDLGRSFGFRETGFANAPMMQGHAFDQAHLSLMETGFGSTMGLALDSASTLRLGIYSGNVETKKASLLNDAPTMYGAIAELERNFNSFSLRGSVGAVSEEGSLLGSVSKGAFGDDMRSTTFFANLGTSIDVAPKTKLTLTGSLGHSSFKQDSGLIRSGDNLLTSSFGVGVSRTDFLQDDDVFTLAAGQPMRVEGGKVNLSLPTSRDLEGGIDYRRVSLNPKPSGRELNLQASYGFEVMDGVSTSVGAMHRFDANHVDGQSETIGMVSLSFAF